MLPEVWSSEYWKLKCRVQDMLLEVLNSDVFMLLEVWSEFNCCWKCGFQNVGEYVFEFRLF